ncbi:hypothetical protein QOM21_06190 [Streptomyces sp. Pv4-95]|uniref:hypothetical protein n=1 Tax=Streptomyces sp. Pv4-95 TaxID=3049543 RepID=UPI0038923B0A
MESTQQLPSTPVREFVAKTVGRPGLAAVGRAVILLPVSAGRFLRELSKGRCTDALSSLLGAGLGLVAWFIVLISAQAAVNGALYPLLDAHDYRHSWGGPTPVGAWAAHAALAVPIVVAAVWLLRGLVALGARNRPSSAGSPPRNRYLPLSLLVVAAGAVLLVSWLHQL